MKTAFGSPPPSSVKTPFIPKVPDESDLYTPEVFVVPPSSVGVSVYALPAASP
jgi:hypothetical protein